MAYGGNIQIDTTNPELGKNPDLSNPNVSRNAKPGEVPYIGLPGQIAIDPVLAGWQEPSDAWLGTRNDAVRQYKGDNYGYDPYQAQAGGQLQGMDFNPYQQAALNDQQGGAAQGMANARSSLEQMGGGTSKSDRLNLINKYNQSRVSGAGKYDQLQSQNQLDVGKYNSGRNTDVERVNIGANNQASMDLAQSNLRRSENLYKGAVGERDMGRQLDAAKIIAMNQGKASDSLIDKLLKPITNIFD